MMDRAEKALELARLVLAFGRVERNTFHEDGIRPETDTDHTVMLGLLACALAHEVAPHLDLGKIAQFALVHDLVEAYAGDTVTLRMMTDADHADKREREAAALVRIKEQFSDSLPWLHETIEAYESLATPEARFVKTVDKCLPGLTHALNRGETFKRSRLTKEAVDAIRASNRRDYPSSFAHDQHEAMALWEAVVALGEKHIEYPQES